MYQYLIPRIKSGVTTHIRHCGLRPYEATEGGIWIKPTREDLDTLINYKFLHLVVPLWTLREPLAKLLATKLKKMEPGNGLYRGCLAIVSEPALQDRTRLWRWLLKELRRPDLDEGREAELRQRLLWCTKEISVLTRMFREFELMSLA